MKQRISDLGQRANRPEVGSVLKFAWGTARTVRDLVVQRRLVYLAWSARQRVWLHRWPEGRAADTRWWWSARAWATEGGMYDMYDLLWRHYVPGAGDVVVDVGAGHGGETFFLASMVGPKGRVLAIEAAPLPFKRLQDVVRRNAWEHVITEQVALAGASGSVLISSEGNWLEGNIYDGRGTVEVEAATLDEMCSRHSIDHIDWLKMNIEGAEREAVLGMTRMAPSIRHMTISCHDFLGTDWGKSKQAVCGWLADHGFVVTPHEQGEPWAQDYIYARRL